MFVGISVNFHIDNPRFLFLFFFFFLANFRKILHVLHKKTVFLFITKIKFKDALLILHITFNYCLSIVSYSLVHRN